MPQPPPKKITVVSGSTETYRPCSKTRRIRSVPPKEASSMMTVSFGYVSLTSNKRSTAQNVLNRRPDESSAVWN